MSSFHLKSLRIKEMSLVPRPANPGAHSLLHKMDTSTETEDGRSLLQKFVSLFRPVDKAGTPVDLTAPEAVQGQTTLALHESVDSIFADESLSKEDKLAKFKETVDQYSAAVLELHTIPQPEKTPMEKSAEVLAAENVAKAAITKAEQERDAAKDELKKHQDAVKKSERTTLAKTLIDKTNVQQSDVELLLEKCDGDDKATTALKNILGKNAEIGKVAKLTEEVGRTVEGDPASPIAQLNKFAEEIQKADPKLSGPQAVAKAMQDHPELYAASLTEKIPAQA
jgi:hypothetical protein